MSSNPSLRTALVLILCVFVSCGRGTQPAQSTVEDTRRSESRSPGDHDWPVLEVVLTDLRTFEDFGGTRKQNGPIVLHFGSDDRPFMRSIDRQTQGEARQRGHSIPADAYKDLVRRNDRAWSFQDFKPVSDSVIVANLDSIWNNWDWRVFARDYPDAKGWVNARLPGHSRDGRFAVVRCYVGPSPHGETVTYLLEKDGETWTIRWRFLSHYA